MKSLVNASCSMYYFAEKVTDLGRIINSDPSL